MSRFFRTFFQTMAASVKVCSALAPEHSSWRSGPPSGSSSGAGSKAVYRGDKVTRGVFDKISDGNYVAQDFAPPSERLMRIEGTPTPRKVDVRIYAYAGKALLAAARLYQGQTINFRTPGGGFAPVFAV